MSKIINASNSLDFVPFKSIEHLGKTSMLITQKLHGTNAQILIFCGLCNATKACHCSEENNNLLCGSRNKWLTVDSDNFGFCNFVTQHKQQFINCLGRGRHYGEWCGPGINKGEGLTEKHFYLFNIWYQHLTLPPNTGYVPILYKGRFDADTITATLEDLKLNGSRLVPGYRHPEGVVVTIGQERYKLVFDNECTHWQHTKQDKLNKINADAPKIPKKSIYLEWAQPIRLEKVCSRQQVFYANDDEFKKCLDNVADWYIDDLRKEENLSDDLSVAKNFRGFITHFIKEQVKENQLLFTKL